MTSGQVPERHRRAIERLIARIEEAMLWPFHLPGHPQDMPVVSAPEPMIDVDANHAFRICQISIWVNSRQRLYNT